MATNKYLASKSRVPVTMKNIPSINVHHKSDNMLGVKLSPLYAKAFKTIYGTAGSIKNFMDYVTKPDYPYELLAKPRLRVNEIKRIPKETIGLPNYWAVLAYALTERILQDKHLQHKIKENTIPYTSFSKETEGSFLTHTVNLTVPNTKMGKYLAIIRHIEALIKNDKFNKENINDLILKCRDDDTLDVFAGVNVPTENI